MRTSALVTHGAVDSAPRSGLRSRTTMAVVLLCAIAAALAAPLAAQQPAAARDVSRLSADAAKALDEKRFSDALNGFAAAAKLAPQDASLALGAGYAATLLGEWEVARTWLDRALRLDPRSTDASVLLGAVLYREGKLAEAVAVYEAALKYAPDSTQLKSALSKWRPELKQSGRFYETRGAHFAVLFEGPADDIAARRVVDVLEQAYLRIGQQLSTFPTDTVTVVLYTRQQFFDVTRSPGWAGGYYDGRIKLPVAGLSQGTDELRRILEHEFVHALVSSLTRAGTVPVWLNEGLATVLEPDGLEWANQLLAREPRRLPFARLDANFASLTPEQSAIAYAQSAVAVKKLLDMRGPSSLVQLLQSLGRGTEFHIAFQQAMFLRYDDFIVTMERR
ncbi:MAG TPA: tetratricopeptide repeat protein [Vicinamibacterales bacterium]|nr:tetratricopeptide repeat protein [Vicinamibacterales bacterium]